MTSETELEGVIRALRRGRTLAVNAGAIGITLATAREAEERQEMAAYLGGFIQRFCETVEEALAMPLLKRAGADAELKEIEGFAGALGALDASAHFAALTRDLASELTMRAREATLPAFYTLIARFEKERAALEARRQAHLKEQSRQLEKMFAEVEDIGRMIHLISLNASVEAARAGGESGRSFKVIADEIRSLAAKSAHLIETTRAAIGSDPAHG
ncbi:MAG: methyl-accepting chemotaxis protein [Pseudomonadota bacterium]